MLSAGALTAQTAVSPVVGLYVSTPQKVSASVGLLVGRQTSDHIFRVVEGWLVEAEPGLGGLRGTIGYGAYVRPAFLGYSFGISYLRTWGDPWWTKPRRSFLGMAGDFSFFMMNLKGGAYLGVDGRKRPYLISIGTGVRL